MSKNDNLVRAKTSRNDEYYTRLADIEAELSCYPGAFAGKSLYLPCDSADKSAFWDYFATRFEELGIARLVASRMSSDGSGKASIMEHPGKWRNFDMEGNGDMFSDEALSMLDSADIVVTNLPFSRFRDYIGEMMARDKDFIVIGGKNGGKYQDTIKYVIDEKMRLGANVGHGTMMFETPGGKLTPVASYWYTTLDPDAPRRRPPLDKSYKGNEELYPRYANYDAIEVGRISDIPRDYMGEMGVPVTFLEYYNPEDWVLLGTNATVLEDAPQNLHIKENSHLYRRHNLYLAQPDGSYKRCYDRLIVRRRVRGNPPDNNI